MEDFTTIADAQGGLVEALGGCVDALRDIKTQLGARQDEVRLIWTKWAGGERGRGEEYVYKEEVLLPNPTVSTVAKIDRSVESVGAAEMGMIEVMEISPRYSEGFLLGLIDDRDPGEDVNFYWEITALPNEGTARIRRRYFPASPPEHDETGFQWVIKLARAHGDRTPRGLPRRPPEGVVRG
jgi:hypothetical protein